MRIPTYRIAILLPVEPEYSGRLLEGALEYASDNKEITLIEMPYVRAMRSLYDPLPAGKLPFDGALVWLNTFDTWVERLLSEKIVVVNASGEWFMKGGEKITTVAFKGPDVESMAVEHLAGLGCTHLAYAGAETSDSTELTRRQGCFLKMAADRGLTGSSFETGNHGAIENRITSLPSEIGEELRRFLRQLPRPAGVWCEDDYVARLVCDYAQLEGLRIPDDLAVLGLGDYSVARLGDPPISTIAQPGQLIGHGAVELIHGVLSGKVERARSKTVPPPPVVVRESTGGGDRADERFETIRQWIEDHACEGLTVNDLVKMLPMSQVTFSKHFVRLYGCTPGEDIRRVKTEHAKRHLRTTHTPVEQIASLCGFEQHGKFSKFFKRQTGMTPSEYRKGGKELKE